MRHIFYSEDGTPPSPEHLAQITPLDATASAFLWKFEDLVQIGAFYPNIERYFRHTEEFSFGAGKQRDVKKWLFKRGIPFSAKTYLAFQPDTAFILTWKMVIHYSGDLFFAHDVIVWDRTLNWGLYYRHDDVFHFGRTRIYDGEAEQLRTNQLIQGFKR